MFEPKEKLKFIKHSKNRYFKYNNYEFEIYPVLFTDEQALIRNNANIALGEYAIRCYLLLKKERNEYLEYLENKNLTNRIFEKTLEGIDLNVLKDSLYVIDNGFDIESYLCYDSLEMSQLTFKEDEDIMLFCKQLVDTKLMNSEIIRWLKEKEERIKIARAKKEEEFKNTLSDMKAKGIDIKELKEKNKIFDDYITKLPYDIQNKILKELK